MISRGDIILIIKDDGTLYTIEIVDVLFDIEYQFSPMVYYCHSTRPNEIDCTTIDTMMNWFKGDTEKQFSYTIIYNNELTKPSPMTVSVNTPKKTKRNNVKSKR